MYLPSPEILKNFISTEKRSGKEPKLLNPVSPKPNVVLGLRLAHFQQGLPKRSQWLCAGAAVFRV